MARRIYWTILVLILAAGVLLYYNKEGFAATTLIGLLFVLTMLLGGCMHGIVEHSLPPNVKGGLILYPLVMGAAFALLFFIVVFFIMPLFVPGFLCQ
jgi:hypothetical protein